MPGEKHLQVRPAAQLVHLRLELDPHQLAQGVQDQVTVGLAGDLLARYPRHEGVQPRAEVCVVLDRQGPVQFRQFVGVGIPAEALQQAGSEGQPDLVVGIVVPQSSPLVHPQREVTGLQHQAAVVDVVQVVGGPHQLMDRRWLLGQGEVSVPGHPHQKPRGSRLGPVVGPSEQFPPGGGRALHVVQAVQERIGVVNVVIKSRNTEAVPVVVIPQFLRHILDRLAKVYGTGLQVRQQ